MVEELGFTIENGKIKPVPDSIQARVLTEKSAWFELAQSSALPFSEDGIRTYFRADNTSIWTT